MDRVRKLSAFGPVYKMNRELLSLAMFSFQKDCFSYYDGVNSILIGSLAECVTESEAVLHLNVHDQILLVAIRGVILSCLHQRLFRACLHSFLSCVESCNDPCQPSL